MKCYGFSFMSISIFNPTLCILVAAVDRFIWDFEFRTNLFIIQLRLFLNFLFLFGSGW